jgi:hypothetical protein
VLRSLVQIGIPSFIGLVVVVPLIIQIVLEELGEHMPDSLRLWLVGAATVITGVGVALTRIMAIPAVNSWLARFGLAATPKKEII